MLRTRVIKDQVVLRTNAQNLVMMNDHNYRERKENETTLTATVNMPTVKIESHDVIFNVGDAKSEKQRK